MGDWDTRREPLKSQPLVSISSGGERWPSVSVMKGSDCCNVTETLVPLSPLPPSNHLSHLSLATKRRSSFQISHGQTMSLWN